MYKAISKDRYMLGEKSIAALNRIKVNKTKIKLIRNRNNLRTWMKVKNNSTNPLREVQEDIATIKQE